MRTTAELAGVRLLSILVVAIVLVGCGGEKNIVQSTTGPSALAASAALPGDASDEATSSIAGEAGTLEKGGNGNGKGNGNQGGGNEDGEDDDDDKQGQNGNGPGRSHEASVVGFVSARTGDTLTVNGVAVTAGTDAVIRHGWRILTLADIQVGDHVQARGTMDGSTLVATEIKVQDTSNDNDGDGDDDGDGDETEIEGTIANLSSTGNCPVVTFTIGSDTVKTSAATVFDDVTCANLANNARVEVEGIEQSDGSILATRVEAEAGPDEVVGIVFEFSGSGSCPAATFKVGPTLNSATAVTTTASTTFSGVTCATLSNGATVEVEGTKQANGSIAAASVELK